MFAELKADQGSAKKNLRPVLCGREYRSIRLEVSKGFTLLTRLSRSDQQTELTTRKSVDQWETLQSYMITGLL